MGSAQERSDLCVSLLSQEEGGEEEGQMTDTSYATSASAAAEEPVKDKGFLVRICFLLLGTSYLLPFFSFTSAVDYFGKQLPSYSSGLNSIIALVYNAGAFMVFVPVFLVARKLTYTSRILVTFSIDCFVLCVSPFVKVLCAGNETAAFGLFCTLVFLSGCAASVIDSAVMSLATNFPTSYVASVMIGIGVSSVLITSLRMIFIVSMGDSENDLEKSAAIYFALSASLMVMAMVLYMASRKTAFFVRYAKTLAQKKEKRRLLPERDQLSSSDSSLQTLHREGSGSASSGAPRSQSFVPASFISPTMKGSGGAHHQPRRSGSTNMNSSEEYLNERDVLLPKGAASRSKGSIQSEDGDDFYYTSREMYERPPSPPEKKGRRCGLLKTTIKNTRKGWRFIKGPAISLFTTYCFSTVIFPGFLSEVLGPSNWNPDLYTVSNLAMWNASDFAGRLTCRHLKFVKRSWLVPASVIRILLLPGFLLCVNPSIINHPAVVYLLCVAQGYTNGVLGTLSFTMSFQAVESDALREAGIVRKREQDSIQDAVGTFMSFVLNLGLIVGGALGVLLTKLAG